MYRNNFLQYNPQPPPRYIPGYALISQSASAGIPVGIIF